MSKNLSPSAISKFQQQILAYYRTYGREMPWRETNDPYHVFVSEIMLQQTQVSRVEEKYKQFIAAFPTVAALDKAPLSDVYGIWQGLGYNRRALSLKRAANAVMSGHQGCIPKNAPVLQALPGIGKATASSIMAFAFNLPVVFIETNIRTVFIHFFFNGKKLVSDEEILPLVEKCLYKKSPRIWYWALMDYGAMLKKNGEDKNRRSKHYVKKSRFEGSRRQLRGNVLKSLLSNRYVNVKTVADSTGDPKDRVCEVLEQLKREGFLKKFKGKYKLQEKME
jgi:A/G-specific adenine glycosylase